MTRSAKLARVILSGPDSMDRRTFLDQWLVTGGNRTAGTVVRAQMYHAVPRDPADCEFRTFVSTTEAYRWLTEGVTLTPTCRHCGMGEDRHVAPHDFDAEQEGAI